MSLSAVPKRRVTSYISGRHGEILRKHMLLLGSLRKVLEAALDALELGPANVTPEDELRKRLLGANSCIILADALAAFIEGKASQLPESGLHEYEVTLATGKPIEECSLDEVVMAYVRFARAAGFFEAIEHTVDGRGRHTVTIHHYYTSRYGCTLFADVIKALCEKKGATTTVHLQDRYAQARIEDLTRGCPSEPRIQPQLVEA